jgi:hypothetical protein
LLVFEEAPAIARLNNPSNPELHSLEGAPLPVKEANRGDAVRATEQIETIDLSRRLVSGSPLALYIAMAGFQIFQTTTAIIAKWTQSNPGPGCADPFTGR